MTMGPLHRPAGMRIVQTNARARTRDLGLATLIAALAVAAAPAEGRGVVIHCELTGTVDAGSAAYLASCVEEAQTRGAQALVVTLDTPGGSLESTRQIVQSFLGAPVPVLVWVGPSGARAGSAGVFLTLASHVAGMAPGTNIGAAHPVSGLGGRDPEEAGGEHMGRKVENDAVAFIEAIARQRGRNTQWAAEAVRDSASVPAQRALELNVVEVIAPDLQAFLQQADGRQVQVGEGPVTLRTADAQVVEFEPTLSQRVVHWLANPSVAYVLFLIAMLGIAAELSNPGMIVPGVVGVAALLLSMIAFSALPIQAGAFVLLGLGVALIVAELFVANGLLGAVGVLLLGAGGILLVDHLDPAWFVEPSFRISPALVVPTVVTIGGLMVYTVVRAAQGRREPHVVGPVGMVGERAQALTEISRAGGEVFVHGEIWHAVADRPVPRDHEVVVKDVQGLTLRVEEANT